MKKNSNSLQRIAYILMLSFMNIVAFANNVQVTNVSLTGQNTTDGTTLVQFDLSWENSFRISDQVHEFWDAAWIFVKYRKPNADNWNHVTLSTDGFSAVSGSEISVSEDGMGAFIFRNVAGSGNNAWTGLQLKWNYHNHGLTDNDLVDIKVFAIEMVKVPQGDFDLGDGASALRYYSANDTDKGPFRIISEEAVTLGGNSEGNLNCTHSGYYGFDFNNENTLEFTLPEQFPKGWNAFYCMKYELSQGQYTDFLNCLSRTQQLNRVRGIDYTYVMTNSNYGTNRIKLPSSVPAVDPIIFECETPYRACTYLTFEDGLAYADWCGLRPMTEFEYEKSCRGSLPAVENEFAWGSSTYYMPAADDQGYVANPGEENEYIHFDDPGGDNKINSLMGLYNELPRPFNLSGVFRCGIFAASAQNQNRVETGATLFGIMEMTGHLWEPVVTAGHSYGREFNGNHGDGQLDVNADADAWPNDKIKIRVHGGANGWSPIETSVSMLKDLTVTSFENPAIGWRGVRTSPIQ